MMISQNEIIDFMRLNKNYLEIQFGVIKIGLFGSFSKNLETQESDIDIVVELKEPRLRNLIGISDFFENKFHKKIDIIRIGPNIKSKFRDRIKKEALYV